jgi:ABC-type Fe3+ transport system permease subunit
MSAAAVPLTVLVMVSFVRDIPRELIGTMLVDGGTEWTVFRRLIVPLSKPVLATLAIYDGLDVWNNFILPLILTQSNSVAVLPLGLTKLEGQYSINVPAVMAGVLLSVLPLVILSVVMRRQVSAAWGRWSCAEVRPRIFRAERAEFPAPATLPADPSSVLVVIATRTDERSRSRCGGGAPASVARLHAWQMRT